MTVTPPARGTTNWDTWLNGVLQGHDTSITTTDGTVTSHTATLSSHTSTLASHTSTLGTHTTQISGHDATLITHQSTLDSHDATLTSHTSTLNSHGSTLTSQASTISGHTSTLASHDSTLSTHTSQITTLQGVAYAQSRLDRVVVASAAAPTVVKNAADYVCDGVDDDVQINLALLKASRPGDGFGGEGYIGVQLVGPTFTIGNPITMYPSTSLWGQGRGTLVTPSGSAFGVGSDRGAIEALNADSHGFSVRDLTIGKTTFSTFNGHGIKALMNASGSVYEIQSGSDTYLYFSGLYIIRPTGKGIWTGGISSANGSRGCQIRDCLINSSVGEGIFIDGASDAKIFDTISSGVKGRAPGFSISGGSAQLGNCKAFYRGNEAGGTAEVGFSLTSSRVQIDNCEAQDNGGWGFYITGVDATVTNCKADSNGAQSSTLAASGGGGGFYISGNGVYEGIHAYDRNQSATRQTNGVVIASTPTVMMTGRATVPSGDATVVNTSGVLATSATFGTNSYVRMLRGGTTTTVLAVN